MRFRSHPVLLPILLILFISIMPIPAQEPKNPMGPPEPPPPPLPSKSDLAGDDSDGKEEEGTLVPEEDRIPTSAEPWGLDDELLGTLALSATRYQAHTRRFTCIETARTADYKNGESAGEKVRRYSFLLTADEAGTNFRESRRRYNDKGTLRKGETEDAEPFPPAYAWVFLFSEFNQGYFAYRDLGDHFDGFDWVREIQFKGALPFTDGKDIRQWEGVVLVDAVSHTPLEIRAQPSGQQERIEAVYRRWASAFNLIGIRLAPRPFGYRCRVEFHFRKGQLTFPTRLRYDTFRATGIDRTTPWKTSSRSYSEYKFFRVGTSQTLGDSRE